MTVQSLDHVNIRSACMAETLAFYRDTLGMTVEAPPGRSDTLEVAWILSADGRPSVHLGSTARLSFLDEGRDWTGVTGSGLVDHVAFNCTGHDAMRQRLEATGLALRFNEVPEIGLRQIFVVDPNGILIELNFR